MPFLRTIDDLFICVCGSVRVFLPRERQDYPSIIFARRGQLVPAFFAPRNLYPGPLAPEVDAARSFQCLRDVRAADARRYLKKVELSILRALDKFGVRRAVLKTERAN